MAKVLGSPGRYVSQQSAKKNRRFILAALIGCCLLSSLLGAFLFYDFATPNKSLIFIPLSIAFFLLIILIGRIMTRRMDAYEKDRINFLKGATGEQTVAKKIDELPDEYCVIHDLATPYGNLDHVVIGPTGVFVLETKNWKGVITADRNGGILQNGRPPNKDVVRPLMVRMMNVRTKVSTLCDANDDLPFFSALLVFPSARVDAKWGQTGKARCISDEQLRSCSSPPSPKLRSSASSFRYPLCGRVPVVPKAPSICRRAILRDSHYEMPSTSGRWLLLEWLSAAFS